MAFIYLPIPCKINVYFVCNIVHYMYVIVYCIYVAYIQAKACMHTMMKCPIIFWDVLAHLMLCGHCVWALCEACHELWRIHVHMYVVMCTDICHNLYKVSVLTRGGRPECEVKISSNSCNNDIDDNIKVAPTSRDRCSRWHPWDVMGQWSQP
jgi:hypothetical protein